MFKQKFSRKFIEVIGDWMNFGASDKTVLNQILKLKIDQKYKICNQSIYRAIGISREVKIINAHIGSWTLDLEIAKDFIKTLWWGEFNDAREKDAFIIKINNPNSKNIIVNLDTLWQDQEFTNAIEYYNNEKLFYNEGLEFGNSQREVVYRCPTIKVSDCFLKWDLKKQKWVRNIQQNKLSLTEIILLEAKYWGNMGVGILPFCKNFFV
jgi:hypothetical protein